MFFSFFLAKIKKQILEINLRKPLKGIFMKKILSLFLCAVCLFSLFSCSEEEVGPRSAVGGIHKDDGDIYPTEFLFFNGKEIEFDEFRYYYLNLKNQYLEKDKNYFDNEETEKALKEEALSVIKTAWGARFLAEKHGVKLNAKDKKSVQNDIKKKTVILKA